MLPSVYNDTLSGLHDAVQISPLTFKSNGNSQGGGIRRLNQGNTERNIRAIYSLTKSNCSFFGMISSMCGARRGYSSTTLPRMARWADDLTLDFAPGVMLLA